MYKKIIIGLCIACFGTAVFAVEKYNETVAGFDNLVSKQKLNIINKIQATAENDNVVFSKRWPKQAFNNEGIKSYIYVTDNGEDSLDIIKFDFKDNEEECFGSDNPNFCIPNVIPNIVSFAYNERMIKEYTPDFINTPDEKTVSEVLMKNGEYFDTKLIRNTIKPVEESIQRTCVFDELTGVLTNCTIQDIDSEAVLYTEKVILKNPKEPISAENLVKYMKFDADGNKIEEYIYSSGKHIFYNKKGEVIELCQLNEDKFKYFNNKLPDLYIDVDFIKDDNGRVVEEKSYDRNHKIVRRYTAEYLGDSLYKIHVYDLFNGANWEMLPSGVKTTPSPAFSIRH